jgi:hypothetical protein
MGSSSRRVDRSRRELADNGEDLGLGRRIDATGRARRAFDRPAQPFHGHFETSNAAGAAL